jgi:hypothetical protein
MLELADKEATQSFPLILTNVTVPEYETAAALAAAALRRNPAVLVEN